MGNWGLIDLETPTSAYTKSPWTGSTEMELIFSDEFNTDGRTFYPGDDPFWEAADLHYWVSAVFFLFFLDAHWVDATNYRPPII
jgi:beta-glucan synthesis-associated protein KRE6